MVQRQKDEEQEKPLGGPSPAEGVTAGSSAPDAASHAAPKFGQLQIAIALLEAEAVMMQARASMLAKDDKQTFERLLEVKRRINDVLIQMVGGAPPTMEYALVAYPAQGNDAIAKAEGK